MDHLPELVRDIFVELEEAGVITVSTSENAAALIRATADYHELAPAAFVIEAIPEMLELKRSAYAQLEAIIADDAIIASNTSGFMPDLLAADMQHPERFVIAHFWNPPHFLPLVEVVPGTSTKRATVDLTMDLLAKIDAQPVLLEKAIPGFIGNRIQFAVLREALNIVRLGAADAATVDAVMRASLGRRYNMTGPFESADLGGLNTLLTIGTHLMPQLAKDEDVLELLRSHAERGDIGVRAGQGFYQWDQQRLDALKARRRTALATAGARVNNEP
jgi:3-hydroxybutyryl-CoA dehydrogenase